MLSRNNRRWLWLVAGAVLLAVGAWLMYSTEPPIPDDGPRVRLPTRMREKESARLQERRTLVVTPPPDAGTRLAPVAIPRDPVMVLMPAEVKRAAMVAEFNAIVNSDVGQLMMQCLFDGEDELLQRLRDAGVDPARTIDRVAFIDDAMVLTGDFRSDGWKGLLPKGSVAKSYGMRSQIIEVPRPGREPSYMGAWNSQMLVTGPDQASIQATLDRLEDPPSVENGALAESEAYGEVYGVIAGGVIADVVERRDPRLAQTLRDTASSVKVHADVSHDVALVADVQGADPVRADELRRALGGALAMGRMQMQANGRPEEAQILDWARVSGQEDGTFRMQAGLPYDYMQKVFSECVDRRRAERQRRAEKAAAPDGG